MCPTQMAVVARIVKQGRRHVLPGARFNTEGQCERMGNLQLWSQMLHERGVKVGLCGEELGMVGP